MTPGRIGSVVFVLAENAFTLAVQLTEGRAASQTAVAIRVLRLEAVPPACDDPIPIQVDLVQFAIVIAIFEDIERSIAIEVLARRAGQNEGATDQLAGVTEPHHGLTVGT